MDEPTSAPVTTPDAPAPAAPPAETAAPVTPTDRLAQMSPVERAAWRKDGTVPGVTAPVVSAQGDGDPGESEAAREDHPAPPSVDPAASGAGKTLAKRKQTQHEIINELARKNFLLEGELKGLRSVQDPSRPAASTDQPPAPTAASPSSDAGLVEPQEEDFATYKEFVKATARYEHRLAQAETERLRDQQTQTAAYAQAAQAHDARVRTFITTHPDYLDVISSQTEVYPTPILAAAVLHSELAPELAYHLNTHVDEYRALVALPPGPQLQALGRLEQRLLAAAGSPAAAVSPNHVTRAPAPPVTLGSRPAEPADDVERAGARRDVGAYLRAANARELAARR